MSDLDALKHAYFSWPFFVMSFVIKGYGSSIISRTKGHIGNKYVLVEKFLTLGR